MKSCLSPDLKIGITLAILNCLGTKPVLSDKLNKYARGLAINGIISFNNLEEMLSGPVLVFVFNNLQVTSIIF